MNNANTYVHHILRSAVRQGDVVIDATVGNGHDTAFLAEIVGKDGTVYGFDIQHEAIAAAQHATRGSAAMMRLLLHGHQDMDKHIYPEHVGCVSAVVFNLGYLPGGDKSITTMMQTTITAVETSLSLLKHGGVLTVVCYRHPEGEQELQSLRELLMSMQQTSVTAIEATFINQRGNPPVVFVVHKQ